MCIHQNGNEPCGSPKSQKEYRPQYKIKKYEQCALGHQGLKKTYPTLKTSANFRKAELMRMGNGYF